MIRVADGAVLLCCLITAAAHAQSILSGRVVSVTDGSTLSVLDAERRLHEVRLAGIAPPMRGQQGGYRSKESLAALVLEQPVRVEWRNRDRRGRIVGRLWVAAPESACRGRRECPMPVDAGLAQITQGRAWWSAEQAGDMVGEDRVRYESAEREARAAKRGLWRAGTALPPGQSRPR